MIQLKCIFFNVIYSIFIGLSSTFPEVKQLIEELAKKIAITAAELTSEQLGNHLSVY